MTKNYTPYYVISFLLLAFGIIGISYTITPRSELVLEDDYLWYSTDGMYHTFEAGEILHFYTKIIDLEQLEIQNNQIYIYDDSQSLYYTLLISELNEDPPHVQVNFELEEIDTGYKGFYKSFDITFTNDGIYSLQLEAIRPINNYPLLSVSEEIVVTTFDYSDYVLIPILIGFMGLMFLTMTHFSRRRTLERGSYYQDTNRPLKKREKY